jgi:hypothetical protein
MSPSCSILKQPDDLSTADPETKTKTLGGLTFKKSKGVGVCLSGDGGV